MVQSSSCPSGASNAAELSRADDPQGQVYLRSAALSLDLDRALLRGDPLHERLFVAIKSEPLAALRLVVERFHGAERFRRALLRETEGRFSLSGCPREPRVEALVDSARVQGKPVEWTSREPLSSTTAENAGLGDLLDGGTTPPDGSDPVARAERLRSDYPEGFAHVGGSAADFPLWRAASERYGVNLPAAVRRQAEREGLAIVELSRRRAIWRSLLRSMRPHQWLKNLLVLVPFALSLGQIGRSDVFHALIAFLALSLLTSGSYLVNDLFDMEADRRHPRKRKRPIAAGEIRIPLAVGASAGIILLALCLAAVLRTSFLVALLAYLAITLAYSFKLKRVGLVDVLVIAVLFTLRILAGMLLISEKPSHWLLMFSIFFFLSLAFMKREVEFNVMHRAGRNSLQGRGYAMDDRTYVLSCGLSSAMASIVIFALFITETLDASAVNYAMPELLWGALALVTYWLLRMWLLTTRGLMNDDPILFAARDRTSMLLGAGSALLVVGAQAIRL